ncbi:MAG TPA: hypothetical protein ENH53_03155 [Bacteroidetes bacterium]|nr:hypothetical protein [Bacteroidota bacterium]
MESNSPADIRFSPHSMFICKPDAFFNQEKGRPWIFQDILHAAAFFALSKVDPFLKFCLKSVNRICLRRWVIPDRLLLHHALSAHHAFSARPARF